MEPQNQDSRQWTPGVAPQVALAAPAGPAVADCWNRIGVNGDGTCAELKGLVHCRNCPVYSTAGALLLDRALPAGYRKDWTGYFAREKKRLAPGKSSAIIFRIGPDWLALPTRHFLEIAERRRVHSLPHRAAAMVLGVVSIRGELLICVSLARLLGIEPEVRSRRARTWCERLVVTEWQGNRLAFPVTEVHGIHRYHPEELRDVPATVALAPSSFSRGLLDWHDRKVACLDEELLFATLNRSLA